MTMPPLPPTFYDRDAREVALSLLGCVIARGLVRLRIVETEAYLPGDSASHASRGRTPRNAPMFGPPGRAYVYLCYGIHSLLNAVCGPQGTPSAVLIRGCTVLAGAAVVRERRRGKLDLIGPGKVGAALALDTSWSGQPLCGALSFLPGERPFDIQTAPRVGIDYAQPRHRAALWRYIGRFDA